MPIEVDSMRADMAQEYANRALYVSLHTADPGQTGDNEDTGLGRLALIWNPGDFDGHIISDAVTFAITVSGFYTHLGVWDDSVGGAFRDSLEIDADLPVGDYVVALSYTQE